MSNIHDIVPLLITVDEAAKLLSISRMTLYNMDRAGTFGPAFIKLRRSVRISRRELEDWVAAGANIPRRVWQSERTRL